MQKRTMVLFVIAILFLVQQAFAQYPYKPSESIICGNNVCETSSLNIKIGEEKSKLISGQTYAFKLVNIEKRSAPYDDYQFYFSVNGGPSMLADKAQTQYGINFNCCALIDVVLDGDEIKSAGGAQINFNEPDICGIPDCLFGVELDVYKKWNLVPLYFLTQSSSPGPSDIEKALSKGTCKLEDFLAIYGFDPIKKEYIKFYSWERSPGDLSSSLNDFIRGAESEKIIVGSPFTSVWVYSRNECKFVAEMPRLFETNFLLFMQAYGEQKGGFAPGWNFFSGSKDMEGKSMDEIRGSCTVEKAYTFDANSQSWKQLATGVGPSNNFVFKVTNKCMLGMPQVAPPEVPT